MKYVINGKQCNIEIIKKNNKNTYIRVKENNIIQVTTNYFVTNKKIIEIIKVNENYIDKMLNKKIKYEDNKNFFYYLGKIYDIIIMKTENIEVFEKYIYTTNLEQLEKWHKKETIKIFNQRLKYNYEQFQEEIPFPILKIRKMKTRWGVCNRKNNSITLNSELIKYDITKIDYVIIHELAHFIEFNHSSNFWKVVLKYCSQYKEIRKELRE